MSQYTSLVENTIIRKMLKYLKRRGFTVESVYDGEASVPVTTTKETIDAVNTVDISRIYFHEKNAGSVVIVMGNGEDVISDWTIPEDDQFGNAMEEFSKTLD